MGRLFDFCWLRGLICRLGLFILYLGREWDCREAGDGEEESRKFFLKGEPFIYGESTNFLW